MQAAYLSLCLQLFKLLAYAYAEYERGGIVGSMPLQ